MKPKSRFIASALKTANAEMPSLPFARGARRAAFIAKRNKPEEPRKSA